MVFQKKRIEINKYLIEKWIGLQIYIKDKVRVEEKNIKNFLNKNYKGKLLFQSVEEFDELFKKKEINNLRLIKTLNIKTEEKASFFKILKNIQKENTQDSDYLIKSIAEKEKLLKLLKIRNDELLQERREVTKLRYESSKDENLPMPSLLSSSALTPKREKNPVKKDINYNIIYSMIQKTYDYILSNDCEALTQQIESFQYINSINKISMKALTQMKIIEMAFTFLVYYKQDHIKGNEALYEQLMEEIEQNHKTIKSEKYKKEEELRLMEIHKKMEAKKNRIVFKPTRQDIYSSLIYIEKIKKKEQKMKKKVKKKLDIFDFLYDLDDDKINDN